MPLSSMLAVPTKMPSVGFWLLELALAQVRLSIQPVSACEAQRFSAREPPMKALSIQSGPTLCVQEAVERHAGKSPPAWRQRSVLRF